MSATISFGTVKADSQVFTYLARYQVRTQAFLMYGAGLFGSDRGSFATMTTTTVSAVRDRVAESSGLGYASENARRDSLLAHASEMSSTDFASAATRLFALADAHQNLRSIAVQNGGLIWGLIVTGSYDDVAAAGRDPLVAEISIRDSSKVLSSLATVSAPSSLKPLSQLYAHTPSNSGAALQWLGAVKPLTNESPSLVSVTGNVTWYPSSGDIWYDGSEYLNTHLNWSNPGNWLSNLNSALEIDLSLAKGFFLTNAGDVCTSWTTLPDRYDDCPTAGHSEADPNRWVFSFGSWAPKTIRSDFTYFGAWYFKSDRSVLVTSSMLGLLAQQNSSRAWCPLKWIWCLFADESQHLISTTTASITRGTQFYRQFTTARPSITSISPNRVSPGVSSWLTILGTNLGPWVEISVDGTKIASTNVVYDNAGKVRVQVSIPGGTPAYDAKLQLKNTDAQVADGTFRVEPPQQVLSVFGGGSGNGTVSGVGINCAVTSGNSTGTCSAGYTLGSTVSLVATPSSGHTFGGWSGACTGTTGCSLTMSQARSVTATFNAPVTYLITASSSPTNGGNTSGGGTVPSGTQVTLTATPAAGFSFVRWTENGNEVTTSNPYQFTATASRTLTANFSQNPVDYTISTSSNPSNGGTTSGGGSKAANSSVTVTATPANGYSFVNWTEGGVQVSQTATYTFTATANRSLTSNFVLTTETTFLIAVSALPSNGGTVTGGNTYNANANVTVTATANASFTFTNWTENGQQVSTSANYSFTATASRTLVANFSVVAPTYTITTSSNPSNGGTTSGGGIKNANNSVTVTATPANGYSFVNWTESGNAVSTSSSYSFTATASRSLVANFTQVAQTTYTIGLSASPTNGGTVVGNGTYGANANVTVSASPASGYSFVNWTENGQQVSTSASYSFTATASRTLVANFSQNPVDYTISTSSNPSNGGTTSGGGSKAANSSVTVTASAASGYSFVNWTENGQQVSTSASYQFTLSGNRTLVANFSQNTVYYSINVSAAPFNGGNVSGGGNFVANSTVTLIATPLAGYTFARWTEGGQLVSASATYSFAATANRSLVANFNSTSSPLSITTTSLNPSTATVGVGYAAQQAVTATGGQTPYTWSATGLPSGMSINATTGAVFGTPTASGSFSPSFTVRDASNPQQTASKVLSLSVANASPIELITNGTFGSGNQGWSLSGDAYTSTTLQNYHFGPGYAFFGTTADGTPKNSAIGTMQQTITIPAGKRATLSFWYYVTSQETGSSPNDVLNITLQTSGGTFLAGVATLFNGDKGSRYSLYSLDISQFAGQTVKLNFLGTSNGSAPTVFRIDDVSVIVQ